MASLEDDGAEAVPARREASVWSMTGSKISRGMFTERLFHVAHGGSQMWVELWFVGQRNGSSLGGGMR